MRPAGLRAAAALAARHPHGVRIRYMGGCRCVPCRAANSRYECERRAARERGEGNEVVDAARVRWHLRLLSRSGVGRDTVHDLTGIATSALAGLLSGRRTHLRARNARAILAVQPSAALPPTLVRARATWRLVERLLDEGFTKTRLARELGSRAKTPSLQLKRDRITKGSALKVERLYRRLTA